MSWQEIADLFSSNIAVIAVLMSLAAIVASQVIHIAGESERFAKFVFGRFAGFEGPGLVLAAKPITLERLRVGDVGVVSGPEFVKFGDVDIPIKSANSFKVGDSVRIDAFNVAGPVLSVSNLSAKQRCPSCGHEY